MVYRQTFSVPLLYDDKSSLTDNLSICRLWPLGPVLSSPLGSVVRGRPLLNLSYALNYAVGGTAVSGYHLVNLLIHALAGWTLFALVRRTLRRPSLEERFGRDATVLALAVSAIWAWHPVQTEAVTYLSQRAESLMGLFYLLTLYCFARGAGTDGKSRRLWFSLSALACLAGVGTKEVMVTAPLLVLVYDRTFVSGSLVSAWRRHWPRYVALVATWLPLGCLLVGLHDRGAGFVPEVSWWAYGLTECRVIVKYLLLVFWPHPLVFDYGPFVPIGLSEVWPYLLVLAALLTATCAALRRSPALGYAAGWFFLILAPTSSIVPVFAQPMAENRLYLPLAGVAAFAVLGTFALAGRRCLPVLAAIAVGLGLVSVQRNRDYQSASTLWSDTVAQRPDNERAHNNLGFAWSETPGRLDDAIAQYEAALRLKPDYAEAHNNLGSAWWQKPGRQTDAVAEFAKAVRLKPDYAEAHNNLANVLSTMPGRLDDAIVHYREALRLKPDYVEAHFNLGLAWWRTPGRLAEAAGQFEEVLRLQPDDIGAHKNLGLVCARMPGRLADAAAQFEAVLRLQPDDAAAHKNLGVAWAQMPGRLRDAIAQLEEAQRLKPDDLATRQALAATLQQAKER